MNENDRGGGLQMTIMSLRSRVEKLIWKNELLEERVQRLEAEKEILQIKLEKSKNLPFGQHYVRVD